MKLAIKPAPEGGQGPGRRPHGLIGPPAVQLILKDRGIDRLEAGPFVHGVVVLIQVAAFARDKGWKHIRLLSAANNTFKRDYRGEDAEGQQVPIITVFKRWPDGAIRLHWASELLFEPTDPGQDIRHMGTVEPLWTLFDLTPGGRPNADEQIEYDCCHSNGRSA
jgi:hypothetical protein